MPQHVKKVFYSFLTDELKTGGQEKRPEEKEWDWIKNLTRPGGIRLSGDVSQNQVCHRGGG